LCGIIYIEREERFLQRLERIDIMDEKANLLFNYSRELSSLKIDIKRLVRKLIVCRKTINFYKKDSKSWLIENDNYFKIQNDLTLIVEKYEDIREEVVDIKNEFKDINQNIKKYSIPDNGYDIVRDTTAKILNLYNDLGYYC
jgi:uncharacterized coiled-coil DUF342 family protein